MTGAVVRGIGWKAASSISLQVSRAVTAVILARLLTPEQFGIAAVVLVLSGLASIFTDLALGAGLIQRSGITERDRSTVFWTSLAIGSLLTVGGVALSWVVADFYGEPDLQPLVAVFSLSFLLNGLATTQATLLQRDLDFRGLEVRAMVATLVGSVTAITIAASGGGAWAVILQSLVTTTLTTVLLWTYSNWRPSLVYSFESLRQLGAFGLNIFGARVVWFVNRNIDTVLIGRFLGAGPLGAYAIAYNLMLFPIYRIAQPIESVLFPAMSRMQEDPRRLARGWLRATRALGAVAFPAMLGMIVIAPEFVPVLLGDKWLGAVPVLQLLALVGIMQAIQQVAGSALQSRGRAATILVFTIVALAANVLAFVLGLPFGIVGVAAAYVVSTLLVFVPFVAVCARELRVSAWEYAGSLRGGALAALAMALAVELVRLGLLNLGVQDWAVLVVCVSVGVIVYLCAVYLLDAALVAEARRAIERVRGRRAQSPAAASPPSIG